MMLIYVRNQFGLGWTLGQNRLLVQLSKEVQYAFGPAKFLIFNKIETESKHLHCGALRDLDPEEDTSRMASVQPATK